MGKLSKDQLPQPYLLEDFYLAKMAGLDVELPDPLYASDYYLKYMAENRGGGGSGSGIASDVAYDNTALADVVNVAEALDMIISEIYYVAPKITSFTATPAGGVFEFGTTISAPKFNWTYNKAITSQTLTNCTLSSTAIRTISYMSDITTDKTFTLQASDGKNTTQSTISYKFVYPYYVGVLNTDNPTESDIVGLTKKVETKGNKTLSFTTSQSHMVFAYPSSHGDISKIIDQNGFNVTGSFTKSTSIINGINYHVYISNKCSGSYSMSINY